MLKCVCGLSFGLFVVSGVILNSSAYYECTSNLQNIVSAVQNQLSDYSNVKCIAGGAFGWVFSAQKNETVALKVYNEGTEGGGLSIEKKKLLQQFYKCMYGNSDNAKKRQACNGDNQVKFSLVEDDAVAKIDVDGVIRTVEQWVYFTEKSLDDKENTITRPERFLKMLFLWWRGVLLMRSCSIYHGDMQFSNIAYGETGSQFVFFDWDTVKHASQYVTGGMTGRSEADSDLFAMANSRVKAELQGHAVGPSAIALMDMSEAKNNWMTTDDWKKFRKFFSILHKSYGNQPKTFCDSMGKLCSKKFKDSQKACAKVEHDLIYTDSAILSSTGFMNTYKENIKEFESNNREAKDDSNVDNDILQEYEAVEKEFGQLAVDEFKRAETVSSIFVTERAY